LNRFSARVGSYVALSRAERQLQQLDDRLLLDIGVKPLMSGTSFFVVVKDAANCQPFDMRLNVAISTLV